MLKEKKETLSNCKKKKYQHPAQMHMPSGMKAPNTLFL
jgi:hypothetical protein